MTQEHDSNDAEALEEAAAQLIRRSRMEEAGLPIDDSTVRTQSEVEQAERRLISEGLADGSLERTAEGSLENALGMAVVPRSDLLKPKVFPRYTAEAMVQLMIDNPRYTPKQLAAYFGYKESWFAGVLVSRNFQEALELRRGEVTNPVFAGTMDDMLRGLLFQSVMVIQKKLEEGKASEDFIIKAGALGVKALGLGTGNQPPTAPTQPSSLEDLAERLARRAAALPSSQGTAVDHTIDNSLDERG